MSPRDTAVWNRKAQTETVSSDVFRGRDRAEPWAKLPLLLQREVREIEFVQNKLRSTYEK